MSLRNLYEFCSEQFNHIDRVYFDGDGNGYSVEQFHSEVYFRPLAFVANEANELLGIRLKSASKGSLYISVDTETKTFCVYDTSEENCLQGELSEAVCNYINMYFCPTQFHIRTEHVMSLDEAIEHCDEVANQLCDSCGAEHKQLGKWLRELREYRENR